MNTSFDTGSADNRLLVIAQIGCGPPHMGNRARMKSLLVELRRLGLELHFAGVWFTDEEKAGTLPFVDRWVGNFGPPERGLLARLKEKLAAMRKELSLRSGDRKFMDDQGSVDAWFLPHWREKIEQLQREGRYKRVLVAYVFHSAFLDSFSNGCLKVLDTHDVFTDRASRLEEIGIKDYWFTTTATQEKRGLLRADAIIAIQAREAEYFRILTQSHRDVWTVGHIMEPRNLPIADSPTVLRSVGFIASDNLLNVDALRWFVERVWPQVIEVFPDAHLLVGGQIGKMFTTRGGIEPIGEVAILEDFYSKCLFTINPMRVGTGLKIKTLESLAYGRPIVTTSVGAEGLESFRGQGLEIADDADKFAGVVLNWLKNPQRTITIAREASTAVEDFNRHSRSSLKEALRL